MIADDSVLLREGIARLLAEGGIEVAARAGDAESLLHAVEVERPDLAVIDVRMPPGHRDEGLRAAIEIRRRWPAVALLVLSQFVEERYAAELLSAETSGVGYLSYGTTCQAPRIACVEPIWDAAGQRPVARTKPSSRRGPLRGDGCYVGGPGPAPEGGDRAPRSS